jgi:hypothetical protein
MNAKGLKRKFDIDQYVQRVDKMVEEAESSRNSVSESKSNS